MSLMALQNSFRPLFTVSFAVLLMVLSYIIDGEHDWVTFIYFQTSHPAMEKKILNGRFDAFFFHERGTLSIFALLMGFANVACRIKNRAEKKNGNIPSQVQRQHHAAMRSVLSIPSFVASRSVVCYLRCHCDEHSLNKYHWKFTIRKCVKNSIDPSSRWR